MSQKVQKVSIKGLICQDGKIFMLQDQGGKWELPGGRIDFGEHPRDTLKREFDEELGIKEIEVKEIINVWDFTVSKEDVDYHFILLVFECAADLSKINISSEHLEYKWIDFDDITNHPMRDGYIESINKFRKIRNI